MVGRQRFITSDWLDTLFSLTLTPIEARLSNIQFYERQLANRILRGLLPLIEPTHPALLPYAVKPSSSAVDSKSSGAKYDVMNSVLVKLMDTIGEYALSTTCSPNHHDDSLVSGVAASDLVALFRTLLSANEAWNAAVNQLLNDAFSTLTTLKPSEFVTPPKTKKSPAAAEVETIASLKPGVSNQLKRCFAALWIVGGGSTPIGEGTRVVTALVSCFVWLSIVHYICSDFWSDCVGVSRRRRTNRRRSELLVRSCD